MLPDVPDGEAVARPIGIGRTSWRWSRPPPRRERASSSRLCVPRPLALGTDSTPEGAVGSTAGLHQPRSPVPPGRCSPRPPQFPAAPVARGAAGEEGAVIVGRAGAAGAKGRGGGEGEVVICKLERAVEERKGHLPRRAAAGSGVGRKMGQRPGPAGAVQGSNKRGGHNRRR